jgi:N-acyl-D-amino-acid deacylase
MAEVKGRADVLIRGGLVVDGTGEAPRTADVAISRGKVEAIGDLTGWGGTQIVEAQGLAVAPGFIDMHTHSDLTLLVNPKAESAIRQGVTTQVIGMCGFSPAPSPGEKRAIVRPMFGFLGESAVDWRWGDLSDYFEALRDRGPSTNVVALVGHGTLRAIGVGLEDRPAKGYELSFMKDHLRESMELGAFGLSSGLVYIPSAYADTAELVELARVVAEFGGFYFSHIRNESDGRMAALAEAAQIGREAGTPVQIAHLKCDGRRNWGRADETLEMLEATRAGGVDITYDSYPYTAWNTGLAQLLPAWAREGGSERIVQRLSDVEARRSIRQFLVTSAEEEEGLWERRLIASVDSEANRPLQGRTIAEIADLRVAAPEEVVMDLLSEEKGSIDMVGFAMDESDVQAFVSYPQGMIGSDSASSAPYGKLGEWHPHPRTYGSFARVLGHYVREQQALPLELAVAKMTRLPAERLGLTDRGLLAEGKAADVVVFDPATVSDRATYEQPHLYPTGVHSVFVNGTLVIDGEHHTGAKAGRVLTHRR